MGVATMSAIAVGGSLLGGTMKGIGQLQSANQQSELLRQKAGLEAERGQQILLRSENNIEQLMREKTDAQSRALVQGASQGATGDVTLQIALDQANRAIREESLIREEANWEATIAKTNTTSLLNEAKQTEKAGRFGIASSIIGGVGQGAFSGVKLGIF